MLVLYDKFGHLYRNAIVDIVLWAGSKKFGGCEEFGSRLPMCIQIYLYVSTQQMYG